MQVLCNCGPATVLAILYIFDCGIGELPVDFSESYHASWLAMGVLGTFAAACGDTWSSELGSVVSSQPVLITTLKPVPRGQYEIHGREERFCARVYDVLSSLF